MTLPNYSDIIFVQEEDVVPRTDRKHINRHVIQNCRLTFSAPEGVSHSTYVQKKPRHIGRGLNLIVYSTSSEIHRTTLSN